jgi:anti-sigma factor (TIGR02949 family)
LDKIVAGISCEQVLAHLSDYLDGELPAEARARVEDHLRGCSECARFGGEFRSTVQALKAHLTVSARLPASLRGRLRDALKHER